jgi:hypothetical protein
MKTTIKILCVALTSLFLLVGVSFALPSIVAETTWTYENPIGGDGAYVYFRDDPGTLDSGDVDHTPYLFRYTYQVENFNYNPSLDSPYTTYIGAFRLPVAQPYAMGVNDDDLGGVNLVPGIDTAVDPNQIYLEAQFTDPLEALVGLQSYEDPDTNIVYYGVSNSFWIETNYQLDTVTATLKDGGTSDLLVMSNTGVEGGGPDTSVPEPAALLLFGIGMLGAEALRRSKNRRA